jgi:hypothetical protein
MVALHLERPFVFIRRAHQRFLGQGMPIEGWRPALWKIEKDAAMKGGCRRTA